MLKVFKKMNMKKFLLIIIFIAILAVSAFFISRQKNDSDNYPFYNNTNEETLDTQQNDYRNLVEKANKNETIMVIISLQLPIEFQPEGKLASEQDIEKQRIMIKTTQEDLKQELQGHSFRIYTTYETIPGLAAEVDSATLKALMASSLVKNIQEDIPVPAN